MWLLIWATPQVLAFEVLRNDQGVMIAWDQLPVQFEVNPARTPGALDPDAAKEAIRAAFDEWQATPGAALWFRDDGDSDRRGAENDGHNVVYWEPDWEWDEDILALTSTWSASDGSLLGFDVRLNALTTDWSDDGMDLQNALTHEVGHAIGLDHAPEFLEATMYPSTQPGEIRKRDLHWDDEDGVRYLYDGEDGAWDPMISCNAAPLHTAAFLPFLLVVSATRRRTPCSSTDSSASR